MYFSKSLSKPLETPICMWVATRYDLTPLLNEQDAAIFPAVWTNQIKFNAVYKTPQETVLKTLYEFKSRMSRKDKV